jgi:manganese efflux pump family protein
MILHNTIIYVLLPLAFAMSYFSIGQSNAVAGTGIKPGTSMKAAIIFSLIAFLMVILGFNAGGLLSRYFSGDPRWIALGILLFTGFRAIGHGWKKRAWFKIFNVNLLSVIFALGAALGVNLFFTGAALDLFQEIHMMRFSITVALTSGLLTFSGLVYGQHFNDGFGWRAEIAGGLIILGTAIWLFLEYG